MADLEERVRDGDTSVTLTQIEKARREASFAQLKVDAERRGVEKEQEARHAADVETFMAEYEEYMAGADLDQLRGAYAEVVVAVAYLHTLLEERMKEQRGIMSRGRALGLSSGSGEYAVPVSDDRERWQKQFLHRRADFVEFAVEEGKKGFPQRNAKPYAHLLHTDERRAEIRAITSVDKYKQGREMRDRILDEALTADA
ncbi:hypothetical protein [Nocardia gipuzkoensis]